MRKISILVAVGLRSAKALIPSQSRPTTNFVVSVIISAHCSKSKGEREQSKSIFSNSCKSPRQTGLTCCFATIAHWFADTGVAAGACFV